jgi:hypothetical protein
MFTTFLSYFLNRFLRLMVLVMLLAIFSASTTIPHDARNMTVHAPITASIMTNTKL